MNLSIVDLTTENLVTSEAIRRDEGLLTNDSLVIATMRDLGITNLASADTGFRSVTDIQLYQPQDL